MYANVSTQRATTYVAILIVLCIFPTFRTTIVNSRITFSSHLGTNFNLSISSAKLCKPTVVATCSKHNTWAGVYTGNVTISDE